MNPSLYAVITSKKAKEDYLRIKSRHAEILTGMANQRMNVEAYNQQKQAQARDQQIMKNEMDKEKMAAGVTMQKNTMDFHNQNAELEIKRAMLAKP